MSKVTVIIPSRNEQYLGATIEGLLSSAADEIEIFAIIDGPTKWSIPIANEQVKIIKHDFPVGMRKSINEAAGVATGEFLMKCDAHCLFGRGFDCILKVNTEPDWISIPRRYALDVDNWRVETGHEPVDAHYLRYPWITHPPALHGVKWAERAAVRKDVLIDDEMDSQGSCWFMHRSHFRPMDVEHYGDFFQESQELCLRTWLGGGRVVVNKKTWYAHWHKPRSHGRGYFISAKEKGRSEKYSFDYWWNNRWPDRKHDFAWLVERFWPIPTWPETWRNNGQP